MGTYSDLFKLENSTPKPIEPDQVMVSSPSPTVTKKEEEKNQEIINLPIAQSPDVQIAEKPKRRTSKSPNRPIAGRANRRFTRQGIDIYRDQLQALNKLQFALWRRDDRKPTMRELILTAIDQYIEKMKKELDE
jgi:hypothetical protein